MKGISFMQTTFKIFVSFLLCLILPLLSGCGGGAPKLTPAEQAEVDKILAQHGKQAILHYLNKAGSTDEKTVLKYLKWFIAKGADVNAEEYGDTPFLVAVQGANFGVAEFLLSRGANPEPGLRYLEQAVKNEPTIEIIQFLVSKGADVKTKNERGDTLLHLAMMRGSPEVVKFLVSKGADVNAKDSNGGTPLHWVAGERMHTREHVEVAKFLVSQGADVNAKNSNGETPLDVKIRMFGRTYTPIRTYLESVGAKSSRP